MAEHDQWQGRASVGALGAGGAIDRLDTALARIAAAAGRRQDALRVAELNAQAAQHEADLLLRADEQHRREAAELAASEAAERESQRESGRQAEMQALAEQLDGLIATVRVETKDLPVKD